MRKRKAEKRKQIPDPRYNDLYVSRFINNLMRDGKKSTARKILYGAMDIIREKTGQDELEVFRKAMSNAAPAVEVRSRRVGGATYQVPVDVAEGRRTALSIRWLQNFARSRREPTMAERLAAELMAAANGEGGAIKRRDEVHRMADANRAFAHFKW